MSDQKRTASRIAIVGGGISGIACSWGLRDTGHEVHVYESSSRLGGHANTVKVEGINGSASVDTGFIALNEETYPHFNAFLKALRVDTIPTDMSFSVSEGDGGFEWGSASLRAFIGSLFNLFNPWFWRFLFDIVRFNLFAGDALWESPASINYLDNGIDTTCGEKRKLESIGGYLNRHGYSKQFIKYYIIPMVAAPWCIDPDQFSRKFPAKFLIRFMLQHRLLSTVTHTLRWRTFRLGSQTYVNAFLQNRSPQHHFHLNTPVAAVRRTPSGSVVVVKKDGKEEVFSHVVLAVHANQALSLLGSSASQTEKETLSHFKTCRNVCVVHSDISMLPTRPSAQASWNCQLPCAAEPSENKGTIEESPHPVYDNGTKGNNAQNISITFDMNRLQRIPYPGMKGSPGRVLVSMNPTRQPALIHSTHIYEHPLFSSDSVLALRTLHQLNGAAGIGFAGAWMGYGFHEDGFKAGLRAADNIAGGNTLPPHDDGGKGIESLTQSNQPLYSFCRLAVQGIQLLIDHTKERS